MKSVRQGGESNIVIAHQYEMMAGMASAMYGPQFCRAFKEGLSGS